VAVFGLDFDSVTLTLDLLLAFILGSVELRVADLELGRRGIKFRVQGLRRPRSWGVG
jgi:hypothetical protein